MTLYSLCLLGAAGAQALPVGSFNKTSSIVSVDESCSNNYRSMWSIVSACLLTIFACVYTAIHPNVPSPYDGRMTILRRTALIMLVAVLAPELIVSWAARQRVSSRNFTERMNKYLKELGQSVQDSELVVEQQFTEGVVTTRSSVDETSDKVTGNSSEENATQGSVTHERICSDVFSDQAPLLRRSASSATSTGDDDSNEALSYKEKCGVKSVQEIKIDESCHSEMKPEDEYWTITHSFYAYMGGFMVYHNGKPWRTITPLKLLAAIKEKNISPIKLTEKEIANESKGNFISKGLVILQVTWFCVQIIVRRAAGLAITPLEIGTAGFAALCFVTYALWWYKPLNVIHPRRLEWKAGTPPEDLHMDENHGTTSHGSELLVDSLFSLLGDSAGNSKLRVETFGGDDIEEINFPDRVQSAVVYFKFLRDPFVIVYFISVSAATLFGLVHVAGWKLTFPTNTEKIMWDVGAGLLVGIPYAVSFAFVAFAYSTSSWGDIILVFPVILLPMTYVVCRIILITIMFTSLRDLPLSAFETIPWLEFIPHL